MDYPVKAIQGDTANSDRVIIRGEESLMIAIQRPVVEAHFVPDNHRLAADEYRSGIKIAGRTTRDEALARWHSHPVSPVSTKGEFYLIRTPRLVIHVQQSPKQVATLKHRHHHDFGRIG